MTQINRIILLVAGVLTFSCLLTACDKNEVAAPEAEVVRPVKTLLISGQQQGVTREFPGTVDAVRKADLAFRVSGKLESISVKEGDEVSKDQELARLDQVDLKIKLTDKQASFNSAKADFDRAKKLVGKGHISRSDFDQLKAKSETANAALKAARQDLKYTTLKASFAGYIAKRHVENFEEVSAKQSVFTLQDTSSLDIKIDVPENLVIRAKKGEDNRKAYAVFQAIGEQQFPLTLKEASTQADDETQTYRVTLNMEAPKNYQILPGMSATVVVDTQGLEQLGEWSKLPVSAVVSNLEKKPIVWLVDETSMTVTAQPVETGALAAGSIGVQGVSPGSRVVIAGAAFLRQGMKVSLLETGEQP